MGLCYHSAGWIQRARLRGPPLTPTAPCDLVYCIPSQVMLYSRIVHTLGSVAMQFGYIEHQSSQPVLPSEQPSRRLPRRPSLIPPLIVFALSVVMLLAFVVSLLPVDAQPQIPNNAAWDIYTSWVSPSPTISAVCWALWCSGGSYNMYCSGSNNQYDNCYNRYWDVVDNYRSLQSRRDALRAWRHRLNVERRVNNYLRDRAYWRCVNGGGRNC